MTPLFIAICFAIALFAASALAIFLFVGERSQAEARLHQLDSLATQDDEAPDQPRAKGVFSLLTRPLAPFRNWLRSNDEELERRLALAGYRKPEAVETFLSAKLLAPLAAVLLAALAGPKNLLFFGLMLGATSFFAPDMFLFHAVSRRRDKIGQALPDAMDLLVICMEAGLGIDQAALRIATELQIAYPDLADEILIISREQRAGKPRLEAWRSMAERVDLDTVRQFVAMLVQTERLGTPIALALGQFADGLRTKRLLLAEESAAKTTVKLIFPLVLFIFPAIFVVLLGPAAIAIMQGFEQVGK
jgi:tight adherence protein C